jgi:glycosyltransferase involved in cell wall biosynthesis
VWAGSQRCNTQAVPASPLTSVLYVTYDGLAEPLGQSQVLGYLERLSSTHRIHIVSFEKVADREALPALRERLDAAGIGWTALEYHGRPPVVSTALDVARGARAVRRLSSTQRFDVYHGRSDVPALMIDIANADGRVIFDIRGFWADERADAGAWSTTSPMYRLVRRLERRFYRRADAVVTLTNASVPVIRPWLSDDTVPLEVIPTCAAIERFEASVPRPGGPHVVWCGSVGTFYRFDLAVRMAEMADVPFTVITRQAELARQKLGGMAADVKTVASSDVPAELYAGDVGLCLCEPSFARTASAPTRFAEHLAAGMPVAVTRFGDLAGIVEQEGVGVIVDDESDAALRAATSRLLELAADDDVRARCRSVARERFDAAVGAEHYAALYAQLTTP